MLKIDKLNIIYNDNKTIFKDAFIEIPNSSFISITGPSGSGKTTLLKFILGEINNSNGIMSYDNQIIDKSYRNDFLFNEVSYIDQEGHFFENMSIQDYFEFECRIHGIAFSREEMIKNLKQVRLKNIPYHKSPKLLSTGERKRFLIAVALMMKKNLLLIDEPTASLDYHHKTILLDILHELSHQGMSIIVTTHDEDVLNTSDFIYEIHDHQLIQKTFKNITEKQIHKKMMKPHSINYAKYKSLKLIFLFIICICIGGASIGLIAQNIATLISLNSTTQVEQISDDTALFLVKKLDPRYILENSNIFDFHYQFEGIDYISEDELAAIQNIPGVHAILPCIDIRKTDQMSPFRLYQDGQLVDTVETIATTFQTYNRDIYLTVYYPEEHIQDDGHDIEGIYINDILYNMLETQVDSLDSLEQLSIEFNAVWVDSYESSTSEEKMPQLNYISSRKDLSIPIDVDKVLDATEVLDTRQQAAGRIYIPINMFKTMYDIDDYPTRQYRIICEAGKEEDIKIAIEDMDSLYFASNISLSNQDYVQYFYEQTQTNQSLSVVISFILFIALFMLIYAYCQTRKKEIPLLRREGLNQKIIKKYLNRDFIYMSIGWFILTVIWIGIYGFLILSTMRMTISLSLYTIVATVIALVMIGLVYVLSSLIIKRNIKGVS